MKEIVLYIVIPCYNEETVLPITSKMFLDKLTSLISTNKISDSSRILFVNDGSKDKHGKSFAIWRSRMSILSVFPRAVTVDIKMRFLRD